MEPSNLKLTPSQENALSALERFIQSENEHVFVLKGYAGTGKTTLMRELIKMLAKNDRVFTVMASTGRAAKVLSDKTGIKAKTIHSTIYKFKDLDQDLDELSKRYNDNQVATKSDNHGQLSLLFELVPVQTNTNSGSIIYIVDEASMVSDKVDGSSSFAKFGTGNLIQDLFLYDPNGKFIFVGDPAQLPPINQKFSPALSAPHLAETYRKQTVESELYEIVRQNAQSGIVKASMQMRRFYHNPPAVKFPPIPLKGYREIMLVGSHAALLNRYIDQIRRYGYDACTLVGQTNRICAELNSTIRNVLYNNPAGLQPNDLLMVVQNNYIVPLVNGDLVKVVNIGKREYRAGLTFVEVTVEEMARKVRYETLLVENTLNDSISNITEAQHRALFIEYNSRMKARGINQKSPLFRNLMMSDPYLNALRCSYGYALTCHKTQGGEWNTVYLYLDNKIYGIKPPEFYQWLYTAVTRAKVDLVVVNDWFIK